MNNQRDYPYFGGFVLSRTDFGEVAHFEKRELASGHFLWRDAAKRWDLSQKRADYLFLHGHWAITSEQGEKAQSTAKHLLEIASRSIDEFHEELSFMSGRYVVGLSIDGKLRLYTDMAGCRTIYYSTRSDLVSSHLNLLNKISPHEPIEGIPGPALKHLQWAADYSSLRNVFNLLPNFYLDVDDRTPYRYYPFRDNPYLAWTSNDRLREIERIWDSSQRQYFAEFDKVAASLSGGVDSRLVWAMARDYWDRIDGYTYGYRDAISGESESFYRRTMRQDAATVESLLQITGFDDRHTFFDVSERRPLSASLQAVVDKNTIGDHGKYLLNFYRETFKGDGWINIRGNGLEIPRIEYAGQEAVLRRMQGSFPLDIRERASLLGYDRPHYGIPAWLLIYWELRHGKWLGEIHNELDAAFDTWSPALNRKIFELFNAFPDNIRPTSIPMRDLIDRRAPLLNFPPVNADGNLYSDWRNLQLDRMASELGRSYSVEVFDRDDQPIGHYNCTGAFYMSSRYFKIGNTARVQIYRAREAGSFTFRVEQPYQNLNAAGYFTWSVRINGEVHFTIDGALSSKPVNFSIDGLAKDDLVSLQIESQRDLKNGRSWEKATKIKVSAERIIVAKGRVESTRLRSDFIDEIQ